MNRPGKRDATSFISKQPDPRPGAIEPRSLAEYGNEVVGIAHSCPCGCGMWSWLPLKNLTPADNWKSETPLTMDGDLTKITLTPSIGLRGPEWKKQGDAYHWHGFLKSGVFEEC